jgi:ankyrin repeat protein
MKELFLSSLTGNVNELRELLKSNIDLNIENEEGTTPLCIVSKCRPDLVKWFLERGANPNFVGKDQISPLHWAVEYDNEEIIKLLLSYGAKVDLVDSFKEIPLHWACWTGHLKSAMLLIEAGSNIMQKNHINRTPYDLVIQQHHEELLKYLESFMK